MSLTAIFCDRNIKNKFAGLLESDVPESPVEAKPEGKDSLAKAALERKVKGTIAVCYFTVALFVWGMLMSGFMSV